MDRSGCVKDLACSTVLLGLSLLSSISGILFSFNYGQSQSHFKVVFYCGLGLLQLTMFIGAAPQFIDKARQKKALMAFFFCILVAALVCLFVGSVPPIGSLGMSNLALWFFGAGVWSKMVISEWRNPEKGWRLHRAAGLFAFMAVIQSFSIYIYPHIKAEWGGGAGQMPLSFSQGSQLCCRIGRCSRKFSKKAIRASIFCRPDITQLCSSRGPPSRLFLSQNPNFSQI